MLPVQGDHSFPHIGYQHLSPPVSTILSPPPFAFQEETLIYRVAILDQPSGLLMEALTCSNVNRMLKMCLQDAGAGMHTKPNLNKLLAGK